MRKLAYLTALVALVGIFVLGASTGAAGDCKTIPAGEIYTSTEELVTTGYDEFGYNYQAHMFNGRYCDYDRVIDGDYCDVKLVMKWNDAWISNKSCDDDNLLDRHYGYDSYIGSGAWLTNHQSGSYIGDDGKKHKWTYFVKIVAKPTEDYNCADDDGEQIWGDFCVIQRVYNDPYDGYHGLEMKAVHPGFGSW